jgi:hypothetical protein
MRAFILSLLLASTTGFLVAPAAMRPRMALASIAMGIQETAESCLEEGCPIDLVQELITELKAQEGSTVCAL